jgi:hypothetical protein
MSFSRLRPLAVLLPLVLALAARPASAEALDEASFRLYLNGHALGTEHYLLDAGADTLTVYAQALLVLPGPVSGDTLIKSMRMVAGAFDMDLRRYESWQTFRGQHLNRAVVPHDTAFVVYREVDGRGGSDTYARPPGRLFVLDGQLFSSFEVMCRTLHGHPFSERTMHTMILSAHDTLTDVTAEDRGLDTLRYGNRPVRARKLSIGDSSTRYLVWMGPDGHMLKLEQPESGLRLEREPPVALQTKRRSAP